jgi:RNA polymerase sigma-70 factor (ECF subfamily)
LKSWDDDRSWREFFDCYWKLIYAVARKAGLTDAEAQDVVQEVVINVSRNVSDFEYDPAVGSFKGWLLTMTRWRINDQFRKRLPIAYTRKRSDEPERRTATIDRIADPAGIPLDAIWEQEWRRNLLSMALAKVRQQTNPRHYQIFDCYVIRGWSAAKVAQTLGVNVGQVYLAKHRVGKLLKREAKRLEDDPL